MRRHSPSPFTLRAAFLALAGVCGLLLAPSVASAALVIDPGAGSDFKLRITGSATGYNISIDLTTVGGEDRITVDPHGAAWTNPSPLPAKCSGTSGQPLVCDARPDELTANLAAGNNTLSVQSSVPVNFLPVFKFGAGDDHFTTVNIGGATVYTGAGADTVQMTGPCCQGRDSVIAGDGKKEISLSNGEFDSVGFDRTTGVVVNLLAGTLSDGGTISGVEEIAGSAFADTLIGDDGPNVIRGGGEDTVSGLGGSDEIDVNQEYQRLVDPWPTIEQGLGRGDNVDCGDGYDYVASDRFDVGTTDSDCEKQTPTLDGFMTVNRTTAAPGDVVTFTPPSVRNPDGTTDPYSGWYRFPPGGDIPELLTTSPSYTVQAGDGWLLARTTFNPHRPGPQVRETAVTVTGPGGPVTPGEQTPAPATTTDPGASTPPATTTPAATANGSTPVNAIKPKPKAKPLTRKQKLAKALKLCKSKKTKKARAACAKKARAKYGTKRKK